MPSPSSSSSPNPIPRRSPPPSPSPSPPPLTLLPPSSRRNKPPKVVRVFRSVFRSLPIINPTCHFHSSIPRTAPAVSHHDGGHIHGASRTTGTLYGHRNTRISISIQETSRSLPFLVLELAVQTGRFMQDMGTGGLVRLALECEKRPGERARLLDEQIWSAFANGRKIGYAQRRDPNEADLRVLQLLHAVSMGAGVLPSDPADPADGDLTYMRAVFDRVVGSKDSETFYMLNPDANGGPELSIFFVRI